jgi:hypothetical protein
MSPNDTSMVRPGALCPICGKPAVAAHRPFCSPRCRNVDLGRWLKGQYYVETDEVPGDGSAETE